MTPSTPDPAPIEAAAVTQLLGSWRSGDDAARERLIQVVYDELHRLGERPDHTLQPTALVNEAYLRLVSADVEWEDRAHFYAVAARMMRRILVDHARARGRQKRGADLARVTFDEELAAAPDRPADILALDEALDRLATHDDRKARAVELYHFAGLRHEEIARSLGVSPATVDRDLRMARAWLYTQLS